MGGQAWAAGGFSCLPRSASVRVSANGSSWLVGGTVPRGSWRVGRVALSRTAGAAIAMACVSGIMYATIALLSAFWSGPLFRNNLSSWWAYLLAFQLIAASLFLLGAYGLLRSTDWSGPVLYLAGSIVVSVGVIGFLTVAIHRAGIPRVQPVVMEAVWSTLLYVIPAIATLVLVRMATAKGRVSGGVRLQ